MLLWMSPEFAASPGYDARCVARSAEQDTLSHDNVFDAVLGLMQVETSLYRPQQDMLRPCRVPELLAHDSLDVAPHEGAAAHKG